MLSKIYPETLTLIGNKYLNNFVFVHLILGIFSVNIHFKFFQILYFDLLLIYMNKNVCIDVQKYYFSQQYLSPLKVIRFDWIQLDNPIDLVLGIT